jgi:hypothetical protein
MLVGMTFAAPIIYTFTGNGSGTVNSTAFTNAALTVTITGDTTAITNPSPGLFRLKTWATIDIANVGRATVTEEVRMSLLQSNGSLAFQGLTRGDLIHGLMEEFKTYALATALGPISNAMYVYAPQFKDIATTLGLLTFSAGPPLTFKAVLGSTWAGNVSIPLKMTIESREDNGDSKFRNLSSNFTGTVEMYIGEDGPQPNAEGCYVKFSGNDGSRICIEQIIAMTTDIKKSKTDQLLLIGTGAMTMMMEGTPRTGIAYLDSKGTLKKVGEDISATTLSGKIGGGGGVGTGEAFVLSGNVKATLTEQVD